MLGISCEGVTPFQVKIQVRVHYDLRPFLDSCRTRTVSATVLSEGRKRKD